MEKAVAVKYDESLPAPFIIAKGKGQLAKIILDIAKKHNIFIEKNIDLADNLIELDTGCFIPEKYYSIIANILVYIKHLERNK